MVNKTVGNGILNSAVKQATQKLAEKGVEGCTTKDVILASFGNISANGPLATSCEVCDLTKGIKRLGRQVVGSVMTVLLAIIIALVFI